MSKAPGALVGRVHIRRGMEVVGLDAGHVGWVKEIRASDFLLDQPLRRDIYLPLEAILAAVDSRLVLTMRAGQVDRGSWSSPPLRKRAAQASPGLSEACQWRHGVETRHDSIRGQR